MATQLGVWTVADADGEVIDVTGSTTPRSLMGGAGDDTLIGGAAFDRIVPGPGENAVTFGPGGGVLMVGELLERIVKRNPSRDFPGGDSHLNGLTTITDWTPGRDHMLLNYVDANVGAAGFQLFAWAGKNTDAVPHALTFFHDADGNTVLQGDVDGDGIAEFRLRLLGTHELTSRDGFIVR